MLADEEARIPETIERLERQQRRIRKLIALAEKVQNAFWKDSAAGEALQHLESDSDTMPIAIAVTDLRLLFTAYCDGSSTLAHDDRLQQVITYMKSLL